MEFSIIRMGRRVVLLRLSSIFVETLLELPATDIVINFKFAENHAVNETKRSLVLRRFASRNLGRRLCASQGRKSDAGPAAGWRPRGTGRSTSWRGKRTRWCGKKCCPLTIVHLDESPVPIHINVRKGTFFSVAGRASAGFYRLSSDE